jgi:hypothetical protein
MERRSLGLSPELHTPPSPATHVRVLPATFDEDGGDWVHEDVYVLTTYDENDLGVASVGS